MTLLSFEPACLPVAQNGLPHTDAAEAMALLRSTIPKVLTWPRLPERSFREKDYIQSVIGFPGLVLNSETAQVSIDPEQAEQKLDMLGLAYLQKHVAAGALTVTDAPGLAALQRIPEGQVAGKAVMSQLIGPISLGLHVTDQQQRPLVYNPMLLDALAYHLSLRVGWLSERLGNRGSNRIICLEEPLLAALSSPFCPIDWDYGIELLEMVFADTRACRGLVVGHIASSQREQIAETLWAPLLETSVQFLLFDVYHSSAILLAATDLLAAFLKRSGILAWGLVPAEEYGLAQETLDTLAARFDHLLTQLVEAGLSREQVLQSSLISTSSNLAHLSVVQAERALRLCSELSARLRKQYGLTDSAE